MAAPQLGSSCQLFVLTPLFIRDISNVPVVRFAPIANLSQRSSRVSPSSGYMLRLPPEVFFACMSRDLKHEAESC
jgi:hypothetical protein